MTDTKKPAIATRMHHNNRALNLSYLNENPTYFKYLLYSLIFCVFKNPSCICPYVGIIQIRLWVKTFTVYSQLASAGPPVFICWGRLFVHVIIIVYRLKFVNHNSAFYDFLFRHNLPFYLSNSPGSFFTDILPQLRCSPQEDIRDPHSLLIAFRNYSSRFP